MESVLNLITNVSTGKNIMGSLLDEMAQNIKFKDVQNFVRNSNLMNDLIDEARYLVYFHNTTTLLTTGGLALGIAFIILAMSLYYFYYATNANAGRSDQKSQYEYAYKDPEGESSYRFVNIVEELERAFVLYGMKKEEIGCRKRIACESHLPNAVKMNQEASTTFVKILRRIGKDEMEKMDKKDSSMIHSLRAAALSGEHSHTCQQYVLSCPNRDLEGLPTL